MRPVALFFVVCLSVLSSTPISGKVIQTGICPDVPSLTNFEPQKLNGVWYHLKQYPNGFEDGFICLRERVQYISPSTMSSDSTFYDTKANKKQTIHMESQMKDSQIGEFTVKYEVDEHRAHYSRMQVIAGDYDTYTVFYNCENLENGTRHVRVYVMSKEKPTLSEDTWNKVNASLEKHNLDPNLFINVRRENCDDLLK